MSGRRNRTGGRVADGKAAVTRRGGGEEPSAGRTAVNGVESVAIGALHLGRGVLWSAVSGAAGLAAEAVTGARGLVAVASRFAGEVAGAAQGGFRDALAGSARSGSRRPPARMTGRRGRPSRRSRRSAA
jgi:hypothetical protein